MVGNVDRLYRPVSNGSSAGQLPELTQEPLKTSQVSCHRPLFSSHFGSGSAETQVSLYHSLLFSITKSRLTSNSDLLLTAAVLLTTVPTSAKSLTSASLYVDYIYLDTDERRRFAQVSHEYLIEQLQFAGDESVTSTNNKIKLNFNHPCKELVWVVGWMHVSTTRTVNGVNGKQWFNYTDQVDVTPWTD